MLWIAQQTLYQWRERYGEFELNQARELRQPSQDTVKLKTLVVR